MRFRAILFALVLSVLPIGAFSAFAQTANHVVISEVYGGGGNSGAAYKNDFVELYNPTDAAVDLSGWSVQYGSGTGTSWQVTAITKGSIASHGYFLVQEAQGAGGSVNLPAPDAVGTIAMSGTNGKIALVNSSDALSGANPSSSSYVDLVGYGAANGYEGIAAAPALSNTTSAERKANSSSTASSIASGGSDDGLGNGYDTDNNSNDFVSQPAINPQNSSSPKEPAKIVPGSGIGSAEIAPLTVDAGSTVDFTIKIVGNDKDTISVIAIVVPARFDWADNVTGISVSGTGASAAAVIVDQDTIRLSGVAATAADTAIVAIHSVTVPDSAMSAGFVVKTAVQGVAPSEIGSALVVSVTKLIKIIDLHINDSQGVPAAPYAEGTVVTVSGIVTAITSTSQTNLFLQDATGGVNIFNYTYFPVFQAGDSVTITGAIDQFRGTTEVVPDSGAWTIHAHGRPLPAPLLLTAADVNQTLGDDYSEPNEGRLVRLNGVTYNAANETFSDATGTTGGYIPGSWSVPPGTFDVIGILKQYKPGTPAPPAPYLSDYEVVPRTQDDILTQPGPSFVKSPVEEDIEPNSVTISFKTNAVSSAVVRYGKTVDYGDSAVVSKEDSVQQIVLSGLLPATVYHYQVAATDRDGTNRTGDAIFSTASPTGTSGTIDVFFSKSVDTTVARGENAVTTDISQKFVDRIKAAKYSIDVALYSLSGTVGSNVANALIAAKNRGVKVRMIVEYDNSNTAPMNTMKSSGIPFITDTFDPVNAGHGLMHNKFAIFDFRDTSSFTDDWVWTGSWNATDPGTNNDAQNALEIQDKALANAYTMEFDEMWGSATDTPNSSQSRFGSRKTDNTPHRFNINGTPVELYFSPSDQTTMHIYSALSEATTSINICMLTFTRSDLAQALVAAKSAGEKVRVILDNNTDSGNQFAFLQQGSVDVHLKGSALTGLLHHKYAIIDGGNPKADEMVITGSHNWSNSAETSNNENTLIIQSSRIANLYLQEFKARYEEAGGTDTIALGVKRIGDAVPKTFALSQNYPNPFNPTTNIGYRIADVGLVTLKVYNVLGQLVKTLVNEVEQPGSYSVRFNGSNLASGVYFYRISVRGVDGKTSVAIKRMMILK